MKHVGIIDVRDQTMKPCKKIFVERATLTVRASILAGDDPWPMKEKEGCYGVQQ